MTQKETQEKKEVNIYDFDVENLIRSKKLRQDECESRYFKLLTAEQDLKNAENQLWLNTDFKAQGLTNDKMRSAFVSDAVSDLRLKVAFAKYELKLHENSLILINDLIALRMQEVKPE